MRVKYTKCAYGPYCEFNPIQNGVYILVEISFYISSQTNQLSQYLVKRDVGTDFCHLYKYITTCILNLLEHVNSLTFVFTLEWFCIVIPFIGKFLRWFNSSLSP